jgi:hypothetical protein
MRTIYAMIFVSFVLLTSCISSRKFLVETDYSYNGEFNSYTSFCTATNLRTNNDFSTLDDAIKFQMQLHGYKFSESKPNLLVIYHIFDKELNFQGYTQPEYNIVDKEAEKQKGYDPIKYNLKKGTLLIQIVDTKLEETIWQGYASGVITENNQLNMRELKRATNMIFDRYRFFAEGYLSTDRLR